MSIGTGIGIQGGGLPPNFSALETGVSFDIITTDNIKKTIGLINIGSDQMAVLIEARVQCLSLDESELGSVLMRVQAKADNGLVTLGIVHRVHTDFSNQLMNSEFKVQGNNVEVTVQGLNLKQIKWRANISRLFHIEK